MKNLFMFIVVASISFLFYSCSSSTKTELPNKSGGNWKEIEDPFHSLTEKANKIIEEGGIAAVGQGIDSKSLVGAKEMARTSGQARLAETFNLKVQRLKKSFMEEVGQGQSTEVNKLFSVATKALTSKVLKGAFEKDSKLLTNDKGEYLYGVLMVITPKTADMSLLDEMQTGKPKLYQRFRASQAFKELQKEMDKYEKEQKEGQ